MRKSSYILILSFLFFILTGVRCAGDIDGYNKYFTIRNSSSDTIVVVLHYNFPDTFAELKDYWYNTKYRSNIIVPNESGTVRDLCYEYYQISFFSISDLHASGYRYQELYKYPVLGRFTFTSEAISSLNLGFTFYYPPLKRPTVENWVESWERWIERAETVDSLVAWPLDVPFYSGIMN